MVREIATAEQLSELIRVGSGYLYNDFGGSDPKACPIHAVGCRWVRKMLTSTSGRLTVPKLWGDDLDGLVAEVRSRGKVYAFCGSEPGLRNGSPRLDTSEPRPSPPSKLHAPTQPVQPSLADGFHVTTENREVLVSSPYRLQFDSKPRTNSLKSAIGNAVATLKAKPGEILEAVYTSEVTDLVDAENVLLYNVGTGRFAAAAISGLRVERVYARPPGAKGEEHHHRYALVPADSVSRHWKRERLLARASGILLPRMDEMSKPDAAWLGVRKSAPSDARSYDGHYALDIGLTVGEHEKCRPADVVKPLVDGLVAGLQAHDGSEASVVTRRLSTRLGLESEYVSRLLHDQSRAWLGTRRLLWARAEGLQWNPGDDVCVSVTLRVCRDDVPQWRMGFELHTVGALD